MSKSNDTYYFLNGGGEMGKLLRAKDWSKNILGTPDTWPQSLRTTISIILNSKFPMFLWWGTEFTCLYNDAYRPILGNEGKHPEILGQKAETAWPEIWTIIKPLIDQVMDGGGATWSENQLIPIFRNNKIEDVYWTFIYSPVFDESEKISGVMVICNETTAAVVAYNKLKESEERFKTMADNIPNLAWMAEPDGDVYWYNKKWYEYTGSTFETMQNWGWQTIYKEEELPEVLNQWQHSLKTGVPFERVSLLKGESGQYRQFLTRALPVKNDQGKIVNWFGTNTDITEHFEIKAELQDNKNQLEFVLEAAKLGTFDYNPYTNKLAVNHRLKKWFGLSITKDIELNQATNAIVKNDQPRVIKAIEKALDYKSGGNYDIAYNIINPITNHEITLHAKGKAWFNEEKQAYRFNGTVEDITAQTLDRKKLEQSENNLRLMIIQAPIAIAILRGKDYVVEIANKNALELWGKTEKEILHKSIIEAMPELIVQGIKALLDGVLHTGERFATTELQLTMVRFGVPETIYINFSFEPLFDEEGNTNGVMAIGYDVTNQFLARQKIEKNEQNLRSLVESAPFPIGVYIGREMRIALANQAIVTAWGKGSDLIGKLYKDILPELENQDIYQKLDDVYTSGIAYHAKNQRVDLVTDGTLKTYYFNYSFTPVVDSFGAIYGVMNTAADVTELHEAKQKTEESEKRFRDAVQQAPTAMVIFKGMNHVVETVNKSYLELVDRKEENFLGKPLFESLPEAEAAVGSIIENIYKTGEPFYGYEFPLTLKRFGQEALTYFNFVYHPLKENDKVNGIIAVATEVTATVIAKKELEKNEQKLQVIINASELGVWELDVLTDVTTISDRALEILGIDNDKNIAREELLRNLHPDDKDKREAAFQKAYRTGILQYEVRMIINNQIHWIEAKGKVFYDSDNYPIRMLGTLRDISEERNFQTQLLEREQKFRLLADSMPQFIWTADPEGNLNYFNQSVFNFSGLTHEEIIKTGWLEIVHLDDREENIQKWKESITTERDFLIEHRFRKSDGTYRWQLSRAIAQRDSDGKITMWVGTSTDIQDQKIFTNELEKKVSERTKELYQKNDALEKMNKELQSFAYISSHDLQEPLRKIQTFATLINDREAPNLSQSGKDKFKRMQNAANRMQNLIQDLLAYSRTSVQERKFEKTKLSIIINEVQEDLQEELSLKKAEITVNKDCEIKVIPFQFRQLLFNLVSNSLKFAQENSPPKIAIICEIATGEELQQEQLVPENKYCRISIKDNGIGFEEEYNEKIFEVFQRLHGKEKFEGTGIGLAIVKKIVDNHNGFISAKGIHNQGATFTIYLPV
ncbi:PAS domain-containing protein [Flavobacterium sp. 7A]|uniref:PAS domain-containing protein n=1 Tax=Flavobacterium sp. 7A TaxID=2940571 RepID=UPI00222777C9|nr:PAS domain-containing protein [Flavobacterium sp. 7A]MCW2119688.1 PAS domain S-box-containing protein [Flavobacterium sp. 7A]